VPEKSHCGYDQAREIYVAPQLPLRNAIGCNLLIYDDLQLISARRVLAFIVVDAVAANGGVCRFDI